ncbi:MAG: penicillin-binding protein 2 [Bacteroidales bacterium]|nr:penicillin-binding protein 2 [Bacteroidales bacterium]
MERVLANRKYIIIGFFALIGFFFLVRLFYVQILVDKYILSANNNVLRYMTQYPARGLIFDRFGKLLVYNEAAYDLMVIPRQVKKPDTAALCELIGIDKQEFIRRLEKARNYSPYRPSIFEAQITRENYGYLEEKLFRFPGFFVQLRTLRKYTYSVAAHTLGYIGEAGPDLIAKNSYYKSGDYIGISGIEKSYEEVLRGKKGMKIRVFDVLNRDKGSFREGKYDTTSVAGIDLFSSMDADLQLYGEQLMTNKKGSIVAIEPSTGEILCIVSSPSYDPNLLVGNIRKKNYTLLLQDTVFNPLFNRALMASYPPGSTFKLVDALIGQQEGVLTPETRYSCPGGFPIGNGKVVACHAHPSPLDLAGGIQISCNTYFCRVFKSIMDNKSYVNTRAAFEHWRKLALSFGFGKKLGIDIPNELNGNIPTAAYYDKYHGKNRWRAMTIISLGIGQGEIGITPVQLANLACLIANKGWFYTPHIIRAIGRKDSLNQAFMTKKIVSVDASYFDVVIEGMANVVTAGTARGAQIDSITVCGKTGTAQNPHGKNHSIFIAFAPRENPRIAISVVCENAGFGATWAAPIASLMIEKYLKRKVTRKDLEERMINGNLINGKVPGNEREQRDILQD